MSSGKKLSLKAGDLLAMTKDPSQVALVMGPSWYGPDNEIQTWTVLWNDLDEPVEMDACALEKNWVVLVSRANVPIV
jgi:hypothetical protein